MADRILWTSADGRTTNLTDWTSGYMHLGEGTTGLRSPTYGMTTDQFAGFDGVTVQAVRAEARPLTVGMLLDGPTREEFRVKARQLVRDMRPKSGMGTLTVANEVGDQRSIGCYYTGGLEGDMAKSVSGVGTRWRFVLQLMAPDPWFLGDEQTIRFGLGAPVPFFPIPPVTLSASTVQGQFSVDLSDMDAPAFPVWTVTGPGSDLVLRNESSGRQLSVGVALGVGESLTIDTRPNRESVRLGTGVNAMPLVSGYPDLWPLVDGFNSLSVTLTGATAETLIVGTYRPRFSGI